MASIHPAHCSVLAPDRTWRSIGIEDLIRFRSGASISWSLGRAHFVGAEKFSKIYFLTRPTSLNELFREILLEPCAGRAAPPPIICGRRRRRLLLIGAPSPPPPIICRRDADTIVAA